MAVISHIPEEGVPSLCHVMIAQVRGDGVPFVCNCARISTSCVPSCSPPSACRLSFSPRDPASPRCHFQTPRFLFSSSLRGIYRGGARLRCWPPLRLGCPGCGRRLLVAMATAVNLTVVGLCVCVWQDGGRIDRLSVGERGGDAHGHRPGDDHHSSDSEGTLVPPHPLKTRHFRSLRVGLA